MTTRHGSFPSRPELNRGSALIVGMVLLLLMTAISLTTLKAIKTDEHMSGNLQDRQLAFQAAEAALREAEDTLREKQMTGGLNVAYLPWLYRRADADAPAALALTSGNATRYESDLVSVSERPLYIIEEMDSRRDSLNNNYQRDPRVYRITALGFGGSTTTRAALQASFRLPQ